MSSMRQVIQQLYCLWSLRPPPDPLTSSRPSDLLQTSTTFRPPGLQASMPARLPDLQASMPARLPDLQASMPARLPDLQTLRPFDLLQTLQPPPELHNAASGASDLLQSP